MILPFHELAIFHRLQCFSPELNQLSGIRGAESFRRVSASAWEWSVVRFRSISGQSAALYKVSCVGGDQVVFCRHTV